MSELIPTAQQYHPVFFGKRLSDAAMDVLRGRAGAFCQGQETVYISPCVRTDTLLPSVRPKRFILADADRNVVDTVDWFHLDAKRLRQKYLDKVTNLGEEEYSILKKQFNRLKSAPFAEKASLYLSLMRRSNKSFAPYDEKGNFVATYAYNEKIDEAFCATVEELFCAFKATPNTEVSWNEIDTALMEAVDIFQSDHEADKAVVYIDMRETGSMFPGRAKIAAFCSMAVNRMRGALKVFILAYDVRACTTMFSICPVDAPLQHKIAASDKKALPEVLLEVG